MKRFNRPEHRSPEAKAYRRLYKTARWRGPTGIRAQRLAAEPFCRMCKRRGTRTIANTVDHILEHKGDPDLFFDFGNTQSLCDPCHSKDKQQIEIRGYSSAVGSDGWPIDPGHPANR